MNKNTTGVTIGISDKDADYTPAYMANTGRMVLEVSRQASMVFFEAASMHKMADALKEAANEWDAMEANNADIDYPETDYPETDLDNEDRDVMDY